MIHEQKPPAGGQLEGHSYEIIVNGTLETVHSDQVSFAEAVRLAYGDQPPSPTEAYTVTYRNAAHGKQGALYPGQSVEIQNKTVFDVERTGRS